MLAWQHDCLSVGLDPSPGTDINNTAATPAMGHLRQLWPHVQARTANPNAAFDVGNVPCLFMGKLRNAHGDRLVIIHSVALEDFPQQTESPVFGDPNFYSVVIEPGSLVHDPTLAAAGPVAEVRPAPGSYTPMSTNAPLRVFVGHRDPDDPTGFVVPYSLAGLTGEFHGRLRDDDTVELRDASSSHVWDRWDGRQ